MRGLQQVRMLCGDVCEQMRDQWTKVALRAEWQLHDSPIQKVMNKYQIVDKYKKSIGQSKKNKIHMQIIY